MAKPQQQAKFNPVMQIGDHTVDFSKALPVSLTDWAELETKGIKLAPGAPKKDKDGNAIEERLDLLDGTKALAFVAHFARKANHQVGPSDVGVLSFDEALQVIGFIGGHTGGRLDPKS